MTSSFPSTVRHITVNSPDGTSSFLDTPPPPTNSPNPLMQISYIYSNPANFSIAENTDLKYHESAPTTGPIRSFAPAGASTCVVLDFAPNPTGEEGFMHRTTTLDYVFIMDGELELALDSGEKRIVRKGDVVLQRECMHSWKNISKTEPARFAAVGLGTAGAVEGTMEFSKK
ncbi:hypothetical protein G7Y89_g6271 [Cudoniella acicularis]|uniref:Uncharacterized protein n=1 Tax=Cudoniella acicularis TaxID=354080 RepID=A0A8H4W2K9_9HELO|nr:hypothetical protein G7Y89_g6271 [Cudoniella acicularis]